MFEKLMGGKKKKEADLYSIPEKKYSTDSKVIAKMSPKSLLQLYHDQEKYIALLVQKIEQARQESQKQTERLDQLSEKNEVVNGQISRMTNEHQELAIKFDNLQTSLELFSSENESQFRKEMQFLKENQINTQKVKNLGAIFGIFHEKITLLKKIEQQNRSLKNRYAQLQEKMEAAEIELKQFEKYKSYNNMMPDLLKQIQELKQEKQKRKEGQIQNHLLKLQQNIMQKVKSQIETVSTLRSEEEENIETKISNIQFERLKRQCQTYLQKISLLQKNNGDLLFKIGQFTERIKSLERQLCASKQCYEDLRLKQNKINESNKQLQKNYELQLQRAKKLQGQLFNLRKENQQIKQSLLSNEKALKKKIEEYNKSLERLQILNHELQAKQQDLRVQKESKISLQNAMNGKNNGEVQNLLQIKVKLQREVQQSKKSIDSQKKITFQSQSKCRQLNEQLQNCKGSLKRLGQEKGIVQESLSSHVKLVEEQKLKLKNELKQAKSTIQASKKQSQIILAKIKSYEDQLRNYSVQTEKLAKTIQSKDNELKKAYGGNDQRQKEKAALLAQINEKEEQAKSRARRYESELNQQRIKLQSLNRKLGILESKAEQSKTSMDSMYDQLLGKDKKICQMEIKLKEYKYMIQTLRKEKQDIQNTYEHKLSNMQPQIGSNLSPKINIQEQIAHSAREKQQVEERELLKNQLSSLKEQNIAILAENEKLREEIADIQQLQKQKDKTIKHLQEKRDQMIKQFERIQKKKGLVQASSGFGLMMTNGSDSSSRIQNGYDGRDKKIASKALKGFEIMLKLQHQLYKRFVSVFGQQMEEEQIKGLQKQINAIIKKSCDMKDVFQGYLD